MSLDEVVFEQQRLGLGVGDRDLDAGDLLNQRLDFGTTLLGLKYVVTRSLRLFALPT